MISLEGDFPIASGGFGDVWKGTYREQQVAVKALRFYKNEDKRRVSRVGHYVTALYGSCLLTGSFSSGLLQGDYDLETACAP